MHRAVRLQCAVGIATLLLTPSAARAGTLTCLTGTDPSVANDLTQIAAVRALIDASCICSAYDGSPGKTHRKYVTCASNAISAQVGAGSLRNQCKATVKKYFSVSTCGVPVAKGEVPCVKKSTSGRVSCSIMPAPRCAGTGRVACSTYTTCIDAADTDGDGIIGTADSGSCNAAPTLTPTPTTDPRFADSGDGTIIDNQTGFRWEKKDQSGGLHDVNQLYVWAGDCSDGSGLCQPDDASASACSTATGGALGCAQCGGTATCNTYNGYMTIWEWLNRLNAGNFAGYSDWDIPTVGYDGDRTELETILAATYPHCTANPCVPLAFNNNCTLGCTVTGCSCTAFGYYWSATTDAASPQSAWFVSLGTGGVGGLGKERRYHVRAMRGGS